MRPRAFDTVLLGGGTAGVLDLLDAMIATSINGSEPTRVLYAIASGVLGRSAYEGGAPAATLGVALHFVIAFSAAATYWLAGQRLPVLVRRPVLCGLAFGLAVWGFMYLVVLPVTFNRMPVVATGAQLMNQLAIHSLGVGLPIALFASRSARRHHDLER